MGVLSAAGRRELDESNDTLEEPRRSQPRPESPWLVDQRRAPRSVRTPSPYTIHDSGRSHQQRRQRPSPRKPQSTNPFDSPSLASRRSYNLTPASRNPSPSDGERMLYTPSSSGPRGQRINPFGSTPSPRPTTSQYPGSAMYLHNNNHNNPFDSPAPVPRNASGTNTNPFDSPSSPIQRTHAGNNNNPFESPASQAPSKRRYPKNYSNPFDTPSTSADSNSIVENDSPPSHSNVRVTVHTQQNASPTQPIKHHDSVALDSLEQILDTTEETVDESDEVIDEEAEKVRVGEGWADEPYRKDQQQRDEPQPGGYRPHTPQHRLPQHQIISPYPPSRGSPSPKYFTPVSNLTGTSSVSLWSGSDGTNTTATPSEKALRAAVTLKKSFEERRRRQRSAGVRTEATIHEEEGQRDHHDDLVLEYSRTEEELAQQEDWNKQEFRVLGGVAGKRRAEADFRNTGTDVEENEKREVRQQTLQIHQTDTREDTANVENAGDEQPQLHEGPSNDTTTTGNFTLHDLCDEAVGTDDLAWRNALYLLSVQPNLARQVEPECKMTPLHVACLAQQPPPVWMTRGLLYAAPETCSQPDTGGRLPLHLLVATSAHIGTIRLLVEEYPPGVAHRDDRGFTPLQLLLKRNDADGLTLEHLRLLLGQQMEEGVRAQLNPKTRLSFRRGDHLKSDWVLQELESLAEEREQKHESVFRLYPDDVRKSLTKLSQWKRRQVNKQKSKTNNRANARTDEENLFLQAREADFVTPASIPTPTGQLLPLHLLARRSIQSDAPLSQDIHSVKRARLMDLLRILIAAYPEGLVGVDANGKTPIMTAMQQSDTSPSEEVVELLLGLRTPGFDGRGGYAHPACIATEDTFQMPLHVAAEELLSNYSLLSTICELYPDARTVQDVRGRTPLHLALQNYRSVPVDEATLELLFAEPVGKIKDNDGKTPLDLILENPGCVIREASPNYSSTILQEFFDSSIERPRNKLEAEVFLHSFQRFPPWLRRQACAARFVQAVLVEEIASPFTTFRILGSGIVLVLLLLALRHMLHHDPDYLFLIYYLATYHLIMQVIHWGIAIHMGEFIRLCFLNIWRWIDLATGALSLFCAVYVSRHVIDVGDVAGTILLPVGAAATMSCWLSLVGYCVEWSCGLAIFVGSAFHLLSVLIWPLCIAAMGFFAASQVLFTLEDCSVGGICSLSEAYETIYLTTIGHPVLAYEGNEVSTKIFAIVLVFTILFLWWIVSVMAMIVTEASRLDRRQLALLWYWEPKATLTVLTSTGNKNAKISESPSFAENYCNSMEKYWHIFSHALRGETSTVYWDSLCFRSTPMLILTGFLALFVLPIWFVLGLATLGILWPPQIRRWLFCPRPTGSTILRKSSRSGPYGMHEEDLTKAKLSKLRTDLLDLKAMTQDQNHRLQNDLGMIKDVIVRAMGDDDVH